VPQETKGNSWEDSSAAAMSSNESELRINQIGKGKIGQANKHCCDYAKI